MKQFEMFVDEKVTTWRRNHVVVDAEDEKDAANQILEGNEELLERTSRVEARPDNNINIHPRSWQKLTIPETYLASRDRSSSDLTITQAFFHNPHPRFSNRRP